MLCFIIWFYYFLGNFCAKKNCYFIWWWSITILRRVFEYKKLSIQLFWMKLWKKFLRRDFQIKFIILLIYWAINNKFRQNAEISLSTDILKSQNKYSFSNIFEEIRFEIYVSVLYIFLLKLLTKTVQPFLWTLFFQLKQRTMANDFIERDTHSTRIRVRSS